MLSKYITVFDNEDEREKMSVIYIEHKDAFMRVAFMILKNRASAEDAVHNTFMEIIKNRKKAFAMSHDEFCKWSLIAVKNKCIDIIRKNKHISGRPIDDYDKILTDKSVSAEETIVMQSDYECLKKMIDTLGEQNSRIIKMKYLQQLSYKEIAEKLGITPEQVEYKIRRAKVKILVMIKNSK